MMKHTGCKTDIPIRILQVSTVDIAGGAEKVTLNLHRAYRQRGHHAWLAVGRKYSNEAHVVLIPNDRYCNLWVRGCSVIRDYLASEERLRNLRRILGLVARAGEPLRFLNRWRGLEDFHFPGTWQLLTLSPESPDIIHCHNLHGGYFDLRALPWLSQQMPVVLTLHDAWLLSGHCAHSFGCERWKTGCGNCPDLTIYPAIKRDATAYNWQRKRDIYAHSRLYVATPSQWLMRKVEQSMLAPAIQEAMVIPNGVDLSVFRPTDDRKAVRASLGIPLDAKVLLFAANGIRRSIWRDFQMMRSAVAQVAERLQEEKVLFLALGENAAPECIGRATVQFIPYQNDPAVVARYYQSADVYVHAARAEAWGLVMTEALACGTPVVATAVGGIPEQVEDGITGFLVPPGDAKGMAEAIIMLLTDDALRMRFERNAVKDAQRRFDLNRQVDDYLGWYREILETLQGREKPEQEKASCAVQP